MQCNSGAVIPYIGVIQDKIIMYNIILDYNENSTAQYMYKQAVIHTKLSNRLYPIQYIHNMTLHDNIGLVSWIQIWRPFSFMHQAPDT